MKSLFSKKVLFVASLFAVGAALFSMYPKVEAAPVPGGGKDVGFSIKVEAVKAEQKAISEEIKITGTLLANESATLSSEIVGRVAYIPLKEGSEVEAGALLFKLDDSVQTASLAQAAANFDLVRNNADRYRELAKTGAVSKMKLEEAESDLNSAEANVKLAEANLGKTSVRAPFNGKVGIRSVSVGDVVSAGQKLVSIEQVNPMRVQFSVPEKFISSLKLKEKISFTSDTSQGKIYEAEITAIDPKIDPDTRSVFLQAIANNKDRDLFSGQFVTITLSLQKREGNVVIPDQALIPLGDKYFVFKVVAGAAQKAEVQVGTRVNSEAEIISGIEPGDIIVTAGHQKLQDHVPVTVAEPTKIIVTKQVREKDSD